MSTTTTLDIAAAAFAQTIVAEWPHDIASRAGGNLRPQYVHEEGRTSETNVYGSGTSHVTPDGDVLILSHGGAFVVQARADFLEWIARADEDELDNLMHDNPAHEASDFGGTARVECDNNVTSMSAYETLQAVLDLELWDNEDESVNGTMSDAADWILRDFYLRIWESYEQALRDALTKATDEAAL